MVLSTKSLEGFGGCGLARFGDCRDRFTTREDVSHEAFDGEIREGSFHCGKVAGWLHGNFESVEEILGDN